MSLLCCGRRLIRLELRRLSWFWRLFYRSLQSIQAWVFPNCDVECVDRNVAVVPRFPFDAIFQATSSSSNIPNKMQIHWSNYFVDTLSSKDTPKQGNNSNKIGPVAKF
jgi:hypothetical protein